MRIELDERIFLAREWELAAHNMGWWPVFETAAAALPPEPIPLPPERQLQIDIRTDEKGRHHLHFPRMFISDVHLGTEDCRAKRLSHMLENTISGELRAVGDISDLEYMRKKKKTKFPPWHRQVLAHLLRKGAIYIPGNHDEDVRGKLIERDGRQMWHRKWIDKEVYGVRIIHEDKHIDTNGKVIEDTHGDKFDRAHFGWRIKLLYRVGEVLKKPFVLADTLFRHVPGREEFSLVEKLKDKSEAIIRWFLGVEKKIIQYLDANDSIDGLVYGHSHMPAIRETPRGKLLINDGSSTAHVQGAVEDARGNYGIFTWHKDRIDLKEKNGAQYTLYFKDIGLVSALVEPTMIEDVTTQKADRLIRILHRLAPAKDRQHAIKQRYRARRTGKDLPPIPEVVRNRVPEHSHREEQAKRREEAAERKQAGQRPSTTHRRVGLQVAGL